MPVFILIICHCCRGLTAALFLNVTHRDTQHPFDIDAYWECMNAELCKLIVPRGIKCNDPNCHTM